MCFCKQKTAYEMRSSDWSSDVCSSDLQRRNLARVSSHQRLDRIAEQPRRDRPVRARIIEQDEGRTVWLRDGDGAVHVLPRRPSLAVEDRQPAPIAISAYLP